MAYLKDVVFDCEHPASLARFWAAAIDGYEVAPYDEAELERLRTRRQRVLPHGLARHGWTALWRDRPPLG